MTKFLRKMVVLILVPCLFADPAFSSAFAPPRDPAARILRAYPFTEQAMSLNATQHTEPLSATGKKKAFAVLFTPPLSYMRIPSERPTPGMASKAVDVPPAFVDWFIEGGYLLKTIEERLPHWVRDRATTGRVPHELVDILDHHKAAFQPGWFIEINKKPWQSATQLERSDQVRLVKRVKPAKPKEPPKMPSAEERPMPGKPLPAAPKMAHSRGGQIVMIAALTAGMLIRGFFANYGEYMAMAYVAFLVHELAHKGDLNWRTFLLSTVIPNRVNMSVQQKERYYLYPPVYTMLLGILFIAIGFIDHRQIPSIMTGTVVLAASLFDRFVPYFGTDLQRARENSQSPVNIISFRWRAFGVLLSLVITLRWDLIPVFAKWFLAYQRCSSLQICAAEAYPKKAGSLADVRQIQSRLREIQERLDDLWIQTRALQKRSTGYLTSVNSGRFLIEKAQKELKELDDLLQGQRPFQLVSARLENAIQKYLLQRRTADIVGIILFNARPIEEATERFPSKYILVSTNETGDEILLSMPDAAFHSGLLRAIREFLPAGALVPFNQALGMALRPGAVRQRWFMFEKGNDSLLEWDLISRLTTKDENQIIVDSLTSYLGTRQELKSWRTILIFGILMAALIWFYFEFFAGPVSHSGLHFPPKSPAVQYFRRTDAAA